MPCIAETSPGNCAGRQLDIRYSGFKEQKSHVVKKLIATLDNDDQKGF